MIILGLTGSIGMGKSTVARFFAEEGIPVYSADAAVHALYRQKPLIDEISEAFPGVVEKGVISHGKLAAAVFGKPQALHKLEAIVHPRVREAEKAFVQQARRQGKRLAVLDIPLLLETGGAARVDCVAVVSASFELQRERVLKRPHMTEEKFTAILARQLPDTEKRRRADFIIDTGRSFKAVREDVRAVIKALLS